MKINNDDRNNLKRLLYTAHSIKKFIKNSHIIRLMDGDNDIDYDDRMPVVIQSTQHRVLQKRKTNLKGTPSWSRW